MVKHLQLHHDGRDAARADAVLARRGSNGAHAPADFHVDNRAE